MKLHPIRQLLGQILSGLGVLRFKNVEFLRTVEDDCPTSSRLR